MKVQSLIAISMALATVLASPGAARTATNAERAACMTKIQSKIDAIDQRMRVPYDVREGERLRERRRHLEEARANCRTKA
jgi:uncharacterized protein